MEFSIQNKTRKRTPKISFEEIALDLLGKKYELSLTFAGSTLSRKLNRTYRGKDKPTNVLSFPLSKDSGEVFIDLAQAEKEHKKFGMNFKKFVAYLFIHGCLHLKGMEHGAKMVRAENKLLKKFGPSNNSWH